MGLLVEGSWQDQWYDTDKTDGHFKRQVSSFRNWVTPDGAPGPSGEGGFKAEAGRYHLYVSLACPWAHRTLIGRHVKGLASIISVDVVHHHMGENGWTFSADAEGATGDSLFDATYLHQVYTRADPNFTGRVTVPVLWDTQQNAFVNNESSEILRMLNSAFDAVGAGGPDLYPEEHRDEIDTVNQRIYDDVNNGVYKTGFASQQEAYEEHFIKLFSALDWLDERLSTRRYLVGATPTEADWRLFTTLVRFDPVYVGHFKCNQRRIANYPHLSGYLRELYQIPGIADTVDMMHIKHHYYGSHPPLNPSGIVPLGPELDLDAPHGRDALS